MSVEIVPAEYQVQPEAHSPQEMALRLADMKQRLALVQTFFREVMVKDQDYGIIPGTDKPTLLKPGAEKLCEFYGYAITVKKLDETTDRESGYYRAIATVALVSKRTGEIVAEGVGEANTHEGRYRWRWVPQWKLPAGVDKGGLKAEERWDKNGKPYFMYRVPNEDPWALWNTVLKMAKKRALIDAVLSATRSSGLFTQDAEDLQEWIDAGGPPADAASRAGEDAGRAAGGATRKTEGQETPRAEPPKTPRPRAQQAQRSDKESQAEAPAVNWTPFWTEARKLSLSEDTVHRLAAEYFSLQEVRSLKDVVKTQQDLDRFLAYIQSQPAQGLPHT